MKKLIAISLLSLHLFSLYGHLALYQYFVYHSDKIFNERISMNKYAVDDLVLVKVPVNMPTIENWKDYTYMSGQIQFKNSSYNYVKIKMTRDTIYLMCIPNYKKTRLINQNIIDARKIADIPVNKKDHVPLGKAPNLGEYNYQAIQYTFFTPAVTLRAPVNSADPHLVKCFLSGPIRPPELFHTLS